jgi:prepilin-type N-terminal cleavage/methylation domain-containing protein
LQLAATVSVTMKLRSPGNKSAGFTLVELLTALVIIGLLAGLGLAAMEHIGRANALASGARQFADHINMARNYAVANSRYLHLVVATADTTNAQTLAYTAYGFCVADALDSAMQAAQGTTNVLYVEDLQYLPRGVVFDNAGTNNVGSTTIAFPADGTNLTLTTAWVVTFTPNGQVLPLSRRPRFVLYEGVVDPSTLQPIRTGVSSNQYQIEINTLIGKPSVTKQP